MRIGIVGGVDRSERRYLELAESEGHSLEWHTGDMAGRGTDALAALVDRAEFVIVVTDVNSHAAALGARRISRARGKPCVLVRRLGLARFRAVLAELENDGARAVTNAASSAHRLEKTLASLIGQAADARAR